MAFVASSCVFDKEHDTEFHYYFQKIIVKGLKRAGLCWTMANFVKAL